jgi:hypothetical protein
MTTTKDYIRQASWFTLNGLPDPRLEHTKNSATLRDEVSRWMERLRKTIDEMTLRIKTDYRLTGALLSTKGKKGPG